MSVIAEIAALAERRRRARILYRRPQEAELSSRLVEPYQLLEEDHHLILRCWQVEPVPASGSGWRLLRVDRIAAVEDAGEAFEPRCVVTLTGAMVATLEEGGDSSDEADPTERYANHLEQTLLDRRLGEEEFRQFQSVAATLLPSELRTVHGRVFEHVANELKLDEEIQHREWNYLGDVRDCLGNLGWAPS